MKRKRMTNAQAKAHWAKLAEESAERSRYADLEAKLMRAKISREREHAKAFRALRLLIKKVAASELIPEPAPKIEAEKIDAEFT